MRDEKDLFVNVKVCYFFIDMLEKKEGKKIDSVSVFFEFNNDIQNMYGVIVMVMG